MKSMEQIITCSRCGQESAIESAYTRNLWGKRFCPRCQEVRYRRNAVINYLLLPTIGLILYSIPTLRWLGELYLILSGTLLVMIPLIVLHELAHAFTASLVGLQAFRIVVGAGKPLITRRALGLDWEIRTIPWGAATLVSGLPLPGYRLRLFLVYLAGPLFHIILVIIFLAASLFVVPFTLSTWFVRLIQIGLYSNLLLLLSNLWPRKIGMAIGQIGTDTWNIFNLFKLTQQDLQRHHEAYYFHHALSLFQRENLEGAQVWLQRGLAAYPESILLRNLKGVIHTWEDDYNQALEVFSVILEELPRLESSRPEAQPAFRFLMLNNVAYSWLMLDDPSTIQQADAYSLEAYQNMPWQPEIAGTRGSVLVAMGKLDEGLPLLEKAMIQNIQPRDKAENACQIALGEIKRGDLVQARRYLEKARNWHPECTLIPRVETALAGAPVS